MSDVRNKVATIFRELVGERVSRLDGGVLAEPAIGTFSSALAKEYGELVAADIGFHLADWNADAAFIVAMHLFPERFTAEEIASGVFLFLTHAPDHIREACRLTGNEDWIDYSANRRST